MNQICVGIVGPCAAGKSTLIAGLTSHGYNARHIAQEHSYVPDMWQRLTHPDVLIYLHVDYPQTLIRRQMNWNEAEYNTQLERLAHARQYADLVVDTTSLTIPEVLAAVLTFLSKLSEDPSIKQKHTPQKPLPAA